VQELVDSGMDILQAEQMWSTRVTELKKRFHEKEPYEQAAKAALRGTTLPWSHLRAIVYERDRGTCQVCGDTVDLAFYECGHIIDRVVGGSDRLSNLVCMGISCNRLKPLTETREQYITWASQGGPIRQTYRKCYWPVHAGARRSGSTAGQTSAPEAQGEAGRFEVRENAARPAQQ
jgi:HNH endonuclease